MPRAFDSRPRAAVDPADTAGRAGEIQGSLDGTPYRALHVLGRGGMGEVVAAEHRALGKAVVVKLLHAHHATDEHLADRMRVEAQALARLRHENLVEVHDFGRTAGGRPYYVMERLHGRTLREEIEARGALPALEALGYARQALAGLAVAHEAGLVHRDVKLDNLFLCEVRGGRRLVKVLDFGVAKVLEARDARAPAPTELPTREGLALGTPRFFSPEQACGAPVDARSDVYALGVVLYALVAGRGPFDHLREVADLVRAHVLEMPEAPSRYARGPLPAALDRAILRAMAKRPEDRFPGAAAFSEALADVERELATSLEYRATEPPPAAPAHGRWLMTEPLRDTADAQAGARALSRAPPERAMERAQSRTEPLPPPVARPISVTSSGAAVAPEVAAAPALREAALSWVVAGLSALVFGVLAAVVVRYWMAP